MTEPHSQTVRSAAPAAAPTLAAAPVWEPLRQPLFRALWLAALASNVGTWMQDVGATWLMTSLTISPILIALVQAATTLPVFLLAFVAGALALNGVAVTLARAVGPAVAGLIVAAAGPAATFLLNAVSFLGVVVVLFRWKRAPRQSLLPAETLLGALLAGMRYARHAPD